MNPNGDFQSEWTPSTGGDNYAMIDEAIYAPDEPTLTDYISADASAGDVADLYTLTNPGTAATEMHARLYAEAGSGTTITVDILVAGDYLGSKTIVPAGGSAGWYYAQWKGSWTEASLNAAYLRIRKPGTGANSGATVYRAYIAVF